MKANKIEYGRRTRAVVISSVVAVILVGVGAVVGYGKLRELYLEQCVITDMPSQVSISAGKMVHPSNIAEELGLKTGANLATIDFNRKREELLTRIPNLKAIRISRRLPDKVSVVAEERTPVARLNLRGNAHASGKVVDTEGMVFLWQRGTQTLPTVREAQAPGTPVGHRIRGRTLAALRLIEVCREPEFLDLGVLEVDISKHDFLLATLGNYSKVKIAWEEMDEGTPASRKDLTRRLDNLMKAIRSQVAPDTVIWNATMPDTIFADTQGKL